MVKRDGARKFAHFQNTTIDPVAAENDPTTWEADRNSLRSFNKSERGRVKKGFLTLRAASTKL